MLPLPSHRSCWGQEQHCIAQQSYLLHTGFSPTGLPSYLRGREEKWQKKHRQRDQLMLPSATGRLQRLQAALGQEIALGNVKNTRIWLMAAPTLQTFGKMLLKQPIFTTHSPATGRPGGSRQITIASAPPASPIAAAGWRWYMAAESTGSRPSVVPLRDAKSTEERLNGNCPLKVAIAAAASGPRKSPRSNKPFLGLRHWEGLSSKSKVSKEPGLDDKVKTGYQKICSSGEGLPLEGPRMAIQNDSGCRSDALTWAGCYSWDRKQSLARAEPNGCSLRQSSQTGTLSASIPKLKHPGGYLRPFPERFQVKKNWPKNHPYQMFMKKSLKRCLDKKVSGLVRAKRHLLYFRWLATKFTGFFKCRWQ